MWNFNNFGGKSISDTDIAYTVGANSTFNLCSDSSLYDFESVVLQTLTNYSTGVGISIPGINLAGGDCAPLFAPCLTCCGTCTDLPCLLECYYNAFCTLYSDITTINNELGTFFGPYNTACLTGVTSSSTVGAILQETILELCTAETNIANLQTAMTTLTSGITTTIGNFLLNAITTCSGTQNITKSGTGATANVQFQGFVPVGAIIPYAGSLSNFSGGVGQTGTPMCGWNIANGLNGTVNMLGQTPVGVTSGVGGTLPANATGLSIPTYGNQGGEVNHTLLVAEIPTFPFSGSTAPTPVVGSLGWQLGFKTNTTGNNGICYPSNYNNQPPVPINFTVPALSVSGSAGGNGQAHNNMQPYTGVIYIQRMF